VSRLTCSVRIASVPAVVKKFQNQYRQFESTSLRQPVPSLQIHSSNQRSSPRLRLHLLDARHWRMHFSEFTGKMGPKVSVG
jgi:hypothetical protein